MFFYSIVWWIPPICWKVDPMACELMENGPGSILWMAIGMSFSRN